MLQYNRLENGFSLAKNGVSFSFEGEADLSWQEELVRFPCAQDIPMPALQAGDRVILPIDEGIVIAADGVYENGEFDSSHIRGVLAGREGTVSMLAVEREHSFLLLGFESGIDVSYSLDRGETLYALAACCKGKDHAFYGIFDDLPSLCRAYARMKKKTFRTLAEKEKKNSSVSSLVGGGIFWVWSENYDAVMYAQENTALCPNTGDDVLRVADDLYQNGVRRAMFGLFFDGDSCFAEPLLKRYGYLSTQYDNYCDIFPPALMDIVPNNRVKNCGYTRRRMKDYPEGVRIGRDGSLGFAWAIKGFDGKMHGQHRTCPVVCTQRIKEEVPAVLAEYPFYKGRFIDVFGGNLEECHSAVHPVDREACLAVKNEAFAFLGEIGLLAGTEDGFEGLIDTLDYTEGLHSPVYFRFRDCGRNHAHLQTEEQAAFLGKYMMDPASRIPLWHLLHHEHMLAFPYWGDSTAATPHYTRKKALFACLYGCPPLYSFAAKDYEKIKEDLLSSYRMITAVHEKVAYLAMTDYRVLSEDRLLQMTVFGDRYEVIVNFSEETRAWGGVFVEGLGLLFRERQI